MPSKAGLEREKRTVMFATRRLSSENVFVSSVCPEKLHLSSVNRGMPCSTFLVRW